MRLIEQMELLIMANKLCKRAIITQGDDEKLKLLLLIKMLINALLDDSIFCNSDDDDDNIEYDDVKAAIDKILK